LVDGLSRLVFRKSDPPDLEIVVVDNDPSGLACAFCEAIRSDLDWPLRCFIEPRRGISHARNRVVACTVENVDFIAFIDDDEVPEPYWLDELLYVQRLHDADVVAGPVPPYFPEPISSWVESGDFFEWDRYPTGHRLEHAHTGNVLIRSAVFKSMDKIFDERFALSGGEDTHFFMRVHRAGYSIVWANDALVREWIPKSRTNMKWILMRAFRGGLIYSVCELELDPSMTVRVRRVVRASGRIVLGLLLVPLSAATGRHRLVEALQHVALGVGALTGVAGRFYEEYRKPTR